MTIENLQTLLNYIKEYEESPEEGKRKMVEAIGKTLMRGVSVEREGRIKQLVEYINKCVKEGKEVTEEEVKGFVANWH